MGLGGGDDFGTGIQAQHIAAGPGETLREQPGAAADIQDSDRFRAEFAGDTVENPAGPGRIHQVQRLHRAIGIPPTRGQRIETRDFVRVDRTSLHCVRLHATVCDAPAGFRQGT